MTYPSHPSDPQQPTRQAPYQQVNQNTEYNPYQTSTPQININTYDGYKRVSKIAYVLLALFLGNIGIHKFYAGKVGMGILYLIFFWTFIPGIIAFIEAIVAAFRPADVHGRIAV